MAAKILHSPVKQVKFQEDVLTDVTTDEALTPHDVALANEPKQHRFILHNMHNRDFGSTIDSKP